MSRALLTLLLLSAFTAYGQVASPFTFYLHDTTGAKPDTPFPANFQLAETAVGNVSPIVLKMVNSAPDEVYFIIALVATTPTSNTANSNFSVTGLFEDEKLLPGGAAP